MTLQKGGFPLVLLLFEDSPSSEVRGKLLPPSRPSDSSSGAGSVFLPPLGRLWGASMALAGLPLMLLLGALARIPGSEGGEETPAHFLHQRKAECLFLNGTQRVRYLFRRFYDRQEIDRFDSDLGKFVAVTPLGQPAVDRWNRDEQLLQLMKAEVDRLCRHNYRVNSYQAPKREERAIGRRTKPTVTISPTKMEPSSPNTILLCTATGFYPVEIEIQWLKNGRLEEEGVAFGEELQNGDWTYQLQVMLETQPQRGDVYTCKVEHASLEAPITVQWEPRSSSSARSKLWTGIMGAVIGVAFLAVGLFSYLKSKKATPIQPPAATPIRPPAANFLYQWKHECRFLNGTQRVRFLLRYFYDRQEIAFFDSDRGKFVAVTPLGQADVDKWNRDEHFMQIVKAQVDSVCRINYRALNFEAAKVEERLIGRRAKPTVSISPTKMEPSSPNTILLCTATGFYPVEIEVQWLKNGQPEEEGVAFGEELQNGDWTYQLQVMLETQPQRGDVYACKVGHASLEAPITIQWEPRSSSSSRSKLWTGIMGAVIGVAFLAVGLFSYLKSKKATPIQPPAALMN
ncbi:uncharacterized protein LOC117656838 [Pantherophis guttatus]|uniref:Uncharacterized protein LOC117656838 n=1 Tax=Pantherophis guttatus TaxID=94885 RepID=A0ABM3ZCD5_PANGU|nr:uncharacterized protein LOC117656838 [Pantherophis guttatus]